MSFAANSKIRIHRKYKGSSAFSNYYKTRIRELETSSDRTEKEAELILWEPRPENKPQCNAYTNKADRLFYGGSAGGGKDLVCYGLGWALRNLDFSMGDCYSDIIAQIPQEIRDKDMKTLMWNGEWKNTSELVVGDQIMNPDGQAQEVVHIFDIKEKPCYRLHFEDGSSVDCSEDHLWSFWEARTNSRRKTSVGPKPILDTEIPDNWNINYITRARVRQTSWLAKQVEKGRRFIFPINAPLNYTQLSKGRADRAYFYGVMIGDGTIKTQGCKSYKFYSADRQVIDGCLPLLEKFNEYKEKSKNNGDFWVITIRDQWVDAWARRQGLIGKYSHEKFLPKGYLKASLEFRWALAQGLFDTDGYAATNNNRVNFTTVSKQLADDVVNLVRSLGFMAKISEKQGAYKNKAGERVECRMAYTVNVQGNRKYRLFRLERKRQCAMANESTNWVGKRLERIEPIGEEYGRCIKVSNPNSLYITDGYNVTHNSDLILGLAITQHTDSIIFRTEYPQLLSLIQRSEEIIGSHDSYNWSQKIWKNIPGGRTLEFGAIGSVKDREKYQGRPHDLVAWDELPNFSKEVFEFVCGWNRLSSRADRNQRCRIVATGNPPTTPEGRWVVEYWAPWLDVEHELYPMEPGELVWYVTVNKEDIIVGIGEDRPDDYIHQHDDGTEEVFQPHSRSFIPAGLSDNPDLNKTNYRATLQALPEPLRSQMLFGDFTVGVSDDPWQVIPSQWVELAIQRWRAADSVPEFQTALGVDVARGGDDHTIICIRSANHIHDLIVYPGRATPNGPAVAQEVLKNYKSGIVNIDVTNVGGSPYDSLVGVVPIFPIGLGEGSDKTNRSETLGFVNKRAELLWKVREALDPDYGINLALPPDQKLKSELCAATWEVRPPSAKQSKKGLRGQIAIEDKDKVSARIGRSPDRADSVMLAMSDPPDIRRTSAKSSATWG